MIARATLVLLTLSACDPQQIQAVGDPGGVFRSGAGCSAGDLGVGGASCTGDAQLTFDDVGSDAFIRLESTTLSGKQVSCRRSFCGPGALTLHSEYRWPPGTASDDSIRLGQIAYHPPQPMDLLGKTVTAMIYVDGPTTGINAYLAVVDHGGLFHMVEDGDIHFLHQWITRGGAIRADTLGLPAGTTTFLVDEIQIAVYLNNAVHTGDKDHWSGDFFVDELGWK